MVDQIAVVTFTTPASPGTLDVTDPGITETFRGAIFIYGGSTTDESDEADGFIGIGACTPNGANSASQNAAASAFGNNDSLTSPDYTNNRDAGDATSRCISLARQLGLVVEARFDSVVSGGVRLDFTTTTRQIKVTAILFAGDAMLCGVGTMATSSIVQETTGDTNFTPDLAVLFGGSGTQNVRASDAQPTLGFSVNDGEVPPTQTAAFVNWDDGLEPVDADGEVVSVGYAQVGHHNQTRTTRYTRVSFDTNALVYEADVAVTRNTMYFVVKFGGAVRFGCFSDTIDASVGEQAFNQLGFTPDVLLGMLTPMSALGTPTSGSGAGAASYFVTGRHGSRAVTMHGEVGLTNGTAASFNSHHRAEDVAALLYNHTGSVIQRASWGGASGSGGFILDFSTADAVGTITALGIQLVPNPPLPQRRPPRSTKLRQRILRRSLAFLGGKTPVSGIPLVRTLRDILRARRVARLAARRPVVIPTVTSYDVVLTDNSIATIAGAEMARGAVSSDELDDQ